MAATAQLSVEEYLRTSYAPDREFLDGEVLDRNPGELDHAPIQKKLLLYVAAREIELGVFIIQEQRLQLSPTHYRVPDLIILLGGEACVRSYRPRCPEARKRNLASRTPGHRDPAQRYF